MVADLEDMRKLAIACKSPAAGVAVVMGKAKLLGLIVDKAEVDAVVRKPARSLTDETHMSLEEWERRFRPSN